MATPRQLLQQAFGAIRAFVVSDHDLRALIRKRSRRGCANAAAASCHHGHLPNQR
jgi:hypothetical protein